MDGLIFLAILVAAAKYAVGQKTSGDVIEIKNGVGVNYTVPQRVRKNGLEKTLEVFFRTNKVRGKSLIKVCSNGKELISYKRDHMAPGEMEKLIIPSSLLADVTDAIEVFVEDRD